MTIEYQDRAWASLTAELRKSVRDSYNAPIESEFDEGARFELILLFGKHNLTSDAEPEEMISISRNRVQEAYQDLCDEVRRDDVSAGDKDCYETAIQVLKTLFGSKCLPDELEHGLEQTSVKVDETSVKVEPKFQVGDRVRIAKKGDVYNNSIGEIIKICNNEKCMILFPHSQAWFRIADLEPTPSQPKPTTIWKRKNVPILQKIYMTLFAHWNQHPYRCVRH